MIRIRWWWWWGTIGLSPGPPPPPGLVSILVIGVSGPNLTLLDPIKGIWSK